MNLAWQYYIITVLVYLGVDLIAVLGLNLQFGYAGVLNFAFILFIAAGAYVAAALSLGPPAASGGYQHYILGASLPWPLPLVGAMAAGALLALIVGSFALRPHRRDYQAVVMLAVSLIAYQVVSSTTGIFNGATGLSGVPKPLPGSDGLLAYGWKFVAMTAAFCLVVLLFISNITGSPWGRRLRAMRENPAAMRALGTNPAAESLKVFVIGGALAGLSGGILVEFIGSWAPGAWSTGETFLFFTALIAGGAGNNLGVMVGTVLVLGVFTEGLRFLPTFSLGSDGDALQAMLLAAAILVVLWLRPAGLLPERRRQLAAERQLRFWGQRGGGS